MKLFRVLGVVAAFALAAGTLPAKAADKLDIDPAHTNIAFMIDHLGYSMTLGRFGEFDIALAFDQSQVANSKLDVTVMTDSLSTFHEKRDEHLRSPDFFNTAEFPEMTFTSTAIEQTGDNTGRVTGDLTLLGVTRPVTLDVTFNKAAPHPFNNKMTVGFSARGMLKRSDFGMSYGLPAVGDEVQLIIEAEAVKPE